MITRTVGVAGCCFARRDRLGGAVGSLLPALPALVGKHLFQSIAIALGFEAGFYSHLRHAQTAAGRSTRMAAGRAYDLPRIVGCPLSNGDLDTHHE